VIRPNSLLTLYLISVPVGNKFLCRAPPTWTSEQPLTRGQLLSKRDDFWETSPLYGGKPEIWQVTAHTLTLSAPDSHLLFRFAHSSFLLCFAAFVLCRYGETIGEVDQPDQSFQPHA
jgi:hypothetical protein